MEINLPQFFFPQNCVSLTFLCLNLTYLVIKFQKQSIGISIFQMVYDYHGKLATFYHPLVTSFLFDVDENLIKNFFLSSNSRSNCVFEVSHR